MSQQKSREAMAQTPLDSAIADALDELEAYADSDLPGNSTARDILEKFNANQR